MFQRIADGRTDLVIEFLAKGHAATSIDQQGINLIQWCAYHGDVSAIRVLIQNGESLRSLGANLDLNGAAFHGHWQLCQFLVESGADVNYQLPETGEAPLHSAFCKPNRPIYEHVIEILLASGARPNAKTKPGAVTAAFMRDCRTKGETPLHRAAAFGTEKGIRMLLDAGADPEAKDINGDSPLSWASWHLRPASIIRALCYGNFSIHPDNRSNYDHGTGWSSIDEPFRGKPHF